MRGHDRVNADDLGAAVTAEFAVAMDLAPAQPGPFADWQALSRVVAPLAIATEARVIGISGSQGSGKSSLAASLSQTLAALQAPTAVSSLDDFYLTRAAREELANTVHPLLQTRGVPGTHDWCWLKQTLDAVHAGAAELELPRFDKGADDRSGTVTVAARRLLIEGWCVGVTPQPQEELSKPCNLLEREEDTDGRWRTWVNRQIVDHYMLLWEKVDLWVHLRVPDFALVEQWRLQQEQQLPREQRMSAAEISRFVQHYERLTRWMWRCPAMGPGFMVMLDEQHQVAQVTAHNCPSITV